MHKETEVYFSPPPAEENTKGYHTSYTKKWKVFSHAAGGGKLRRDIIHHARKNGKCSPPPAAEENYSRVNRENYGLMLNILHSNLNAKIEKL